MNSLVSIDINKIDQSLKTIESCIAKQFYEKNIPYIHQSKELVVEKYNLFNLIANYCTNNVESQQKNKLHQIIKLKPEKYFSNSMIDRARNRVKRLFNKFI